MFETGRPIEQQGFWDVEVRQRKLEQKDVDVRWTKKNGVSHYGYKNHVSSDVGFGFIRCYTVRNAAVHDSQVLGSCWMRTTLVMG